MCISEKKQLVVLYKVQAVLGIFITLFMTLFIAVMSMDSPSSTTFNAIIGGSITFVVILFFSVLVPIEAVRELEKYENRKKLLFNFTNTVVLISIFFPVALWQAALVYGIAKKCNQKRSDAAKEEPEVISNNVHNHNGNTSKTAFYILLAIAIFFVGLHYLKEYRIKDRDIIVDCGEDYISTKGFSSSRLYFTNKASYYYYYKYNYHNLGYLDGKKIIVTNPYLDDEIEKLATCLKNSDEYKLVLKQNPKRVN